MAGLQKFPLKRNFRQKIQFVLWSTTKIIEQYSEASLKRNTSCFIQLLGQCWGFLRGSSPHLVCQILFFLFSPFLPVPLLLIALCKRVIEEGSDDKEEDTQTDRRTARQTDGQTDSVESRGHRHSKSDSWVLFPYFLSEGDRNVRYHHGDWGHLFGPPSAQPEKYCPSPVVVFPHVSGTLCRYRLKRWCQYDSAYHCDKEGQTQTQTTPTT